MLEKQLEDYIRYCEKIRGMTPATMAGKRWLCRTLVKSKAFPNDIRQFSNRHINNWIAEQTERGCSGRTVNSRINSLVALLRYFLDMGTPIPRLKVRMIVRMNEQPPRRKFYTREQIRRVLRRCDKLEWLLIKMSFECGLRISELANLRLDDIHGRRITFIGKGNKAREVYISPECSERISEWAESQHIIDYLWVRERGSNRLCVDELRYLMRNAFRRAGFNDFYPHALRHSFATDIQRSGANLLVIKEMLGHSNAMTTERYLHGLEGHLEEFFTKYRRYC